MKKVLIIGKNSYIGNSFIYDCSNDFSIETFDVSKQSLKEDIYKGYDVVIHLAGIAHISNKKSKKLEDLYMKVNRDLAIESCKLAKQAGVKQFIFMSSMSIYGKDKKIGEVFEIDKNTKPNPQNAYGRSKLAADIFIQEQNLKQFKTLVIRAPMVYGEGCKGNYPKLLKLAEKLPVLPKIHNKRSVIEIHNLTKFFKESIDKDVVGVAFPQNDEYMDTTKIMVEHRKQLGKKTFESRFLSLIVKIASLFVDTFKKMYSSKIYKR